MMFWNGRDEGSGSICQSFAAQFDSHSPHTAFLPGQPPATRHDGEGTVALRVMATTDLHGFLLGYDYTRNRPSPDTGLSRVASLIARARAEAPNCLLFDNGDFLQGSLLADFWGQRRGIHCGETHPMIAAMNALGYDAGTPGNHEFNFGLDYLHRVLRDAQFPFVCANALWEGAGHMLPPWIILEREVTDEAGLPQRLRIGVIGFLPPQTVNWDRVHLAGSVTTLGIVEAARLEVPRLRAAGADVVIALAHTGLGDAGDDPEHVGRKLAAVEGIDALVCGHSHIAFPPPGDDPERGNINGKPVILPGRWGSHLGVMDLTLRRRDNGGWRVEGANSTLRPVAQRAGPGRFTCQTEEDPRIVALGAEPHAEIMAELSRVLSRCATPLQSFFSMVAPDAALHLIAEAKAAHVRRALAGQPEADLPLLCAVTPMKCGARGGPDHFIDIPPGPLRVRHVLDLYAFPNTVTAVRLTGAQITEWLERAAAAFLQVAPGGTGQPLLNPAFPSYNFDIFHGLTYEIDPSQPARYNAHGASRRAAGTADPRSAPRGPGGPPRR
ncbi:bifunctional 2',3'-cyclic-nucleotide 2'-phosphodiesterase/3'-nucleotidase [Paenirhodobacter sp.]|uniref:bifunctional 2',3'-cyclic-nucleotide 2'-phosphodiesterase/3'-nucleotidase n=1 Tax=Paenirhodobacter sp. TaxID=1965326 RepID=UPI003B3F2947